jgi:DNA polymerase
MKLITLDFETYFSKDFSLSKMTTESYIRSPEFEVIGVAVKVDDGPTEWATGSHEEISEFLAQFNIQDCALLAHNAAFDCAILSWRFGIHPKFIFDTLSMARPLHALTVGGSLAKLAEHYELGAKGTEVFSSIGKRRADFTDYEMERYGEYCKNDVELTYKLLKKLLRGFPKSELQVIDMMVRMFTEPVLTLDKPTLDAHLLSIQTKKQKLMDAIDAGTEDLMSNDKFADVLKSLGVTPPMKISLRTGKPAYAFAKTDTDFKALLEHPDEQVQNVVAARLGVKSTIEETRTESFIAISQRGTLPILLNYYGAHTGRACLVGDTEISVVRDGIPTCIMLQELLPDDLVWDGEAYVAHEGLVDQGKREVIEYDGVIGTPDHRVYVYEIDEEIELREASKRGYTLRSAGVSSNYEVALVDSVATNKE